jgi:hypothetical protein
VSAPEGIQAFLSLIERFVGNQPDALERIREQISNELVYGEATVSRAKDQLAAIDWIMANANQMTAVTGNGTPNPTVRNPSAPSLRKAIKFLLAERPGYWERDEIIAELERRGWEPGGKSPRNTVISRLSELTKAGVIERRGKGAYRLSEAAVETGGQQSLR